MSGWTQTASLRLEEVVYNVQEKPRNSMDWKCRPRKKLQNQLLQTRPKFAAVHMDDLCDKHFKDIQDMIFFFFFKNMARAKNAQLKAP